MRYAIVIEKAENNYSAYVPDLPGCVATRKTPEETESSIREAIEFHIDGLNEDGLPTPSPSRETLIYFASGTIGKAHGAQKARHIMRIGELSSTAQRSISPAQGINQCFPSVVEYFEVAVA